MKAIIPGSFDPITRGHLDIVERAHELFGQVLVAVGRNSTKNHLFTAQERLELARDAVSGWPGVEVGLIDGLLVGYARSQGCTMVVKGLRFAGDFDYELQMAHLNKHVSGLETIFLPAGGRYATISSSMMREVASHGGDVSDFVTPAVAEAIARRVAERR